MKPADNRLLLAAVPTVYQGLPLAAPVNVAVALFVVIVMRADVPPTLSSSWFGGVLLVSAGRLGLWQWQRRTAMTSANINHWAILLVLGTGTAGVLWGLAFSIFFVPGEPYLQLFVLFVIGGMATGALSTSSQYMPAYCAFLLTSMLPPILHLLMLDDPLHQTIAALIGIYLIAMLVLSQRTSQSYASLVTLQQNRAADAAQFQDFAEASSDWFWEMNTELQFTFVSGLKEQPGKLSPAGMLGRRPSEVDGYQMEQQCAADLQAAFAERRAFRDVICEHKPTQGDVRFYQISGKPLFDEGNAFLGYRGVATDVTEKQLAEQDVHEKQERLRNTLNHLFDGIVTIDEDGIITSVNPAIEKMFDRKAEECVGKPFFETLIPTSYTPENTDENSGNENLSSSIRENIAKRKDGSIFHVDLAMSKMIYRGDEIRIAVIRDITQQKAVQTQLRVAASKTA